MSPEERRSLIPELRALGRWDLVKHHQEQLRKDERKR